MQSIAQISQNVVYFPHHLIYKIEISITKYKGT